MDHSFVSWLFRTKDKDSRAERRRANENAVKAVQEKRLEVMRAIEELAKAREEKKQA